jgi:hypothetical protein
MLFAPTLLEKARKMGSHKSKATPPEPQQAANPEPAPSTPPKIPLQASNLDIFFSQFASISIQMRLKGKSTLPDSSASVRK